MIRLSNDLLEPIVSASSIMVSDVRHPFTQPLGRARHEAIIIHIG